jgi:hypothetical protein
MDLRINTLQTPVILSIYRQFGFDKVPMLFARFTDLVEEIYWGG